MIRIVNGHFSDENSTRDIVGISQSDWDLFLIQLNFLSDKFKLMKETDFSNSRESILAAMNKIFDGELVSDVAKSKIEDIGKEQVIAVLESPAFPDLMKQLFETKILVIDQIIEKAKLKNGFWQITALSPKQYSVVIDLIQDTYVFYNGYLDNFNHKAIDFASKMNAAVFGGSGINFWNLHPEMKSIEDKIDIDLKKHEISEKMIPIAKRWLFELNQPYEGADY